MRNKMAKGNNAQGKDKKKKKTKGVSAPKNPKK